MSELAAGFEIVAPAHPRMPVVAHIPHASTNLPDEVRAEIVLSEGELSDELLRLTDWYTDELFAGLRDHGVTLFVNRLSRLVFDPERFLDDALEPMAQRGQGVVYWLDTRGRPLRAVSPELRSARIEQLYRPYHGTLGAVVDAIVGASGTCTLLDCHSFPTVPMPSEIDQAPDRPDICIGSDELHTAPALAEAMMTAFEAEGFTVRRDAPFAGTFVPSGYYGSDMRIQSVMIEVRRGLYIEEASARRRPDFDTVRAAIERAVLAGLAGLATR